MNIGLKYLSDEELDIGTVYLVSTWGSEAYGLILPQAKTTYIVREHLMYATLLPYMTAYRNSVRKHVSFRNCSHVPIHVDTLG